MRKSEVGKGYKKTRLISLWILVVGLYMNLLIHCYQEYKIHQELFQHQEELLLTYQEQTKALQEQTESLDKLLEMLRVLQEKKEGQ